MDNQSNNPPNEPRNSDDAKTESTTPRAASAPAACLKPSTGKKDSEPPQRDPHAAALASSEPVPTGPTAARTADPIARIISQPESDTGPIERLHLATILKDVTSRLGALESNIAKQTTPDTKSSIHSLLEIFKIILGGWPAFGFLFLVLFYSPLRDALMSIPEKVKSADEIQLAGMSLKSSIRKAAATQGLEAIGETIPQLSSPAIELLLRAPRRSEGLLSWSTADDRRHVSSITFPSDRLIKTLTELVERGLISVDGGIVKNDQPATPLDGPKLIQLVGKFREQFPGSTDSPPGEDEVTWKLNNPILHDDRNNGSPFPALYWSLTDSGAQAVNIIIKAVSTALVTIPDKNAGE